MSLFQNSVLRQYLKSYNTIKALEAYSLYRSEFLPKIANIRASKEEQYQYGFLDDLFVKVLGYRLNPTPSYNLIAEQKNQTDSKKADGAIVREGDIIAVIELKSTKTKVMESIVNQAFSYKNNHPTCRYIITSNFEKLRLYVEHSDRFEEFHLFDLNEEHFILLYAMLSQESIFGDLPIKLKEQSKLQEEKISNELYRRYTGLRTHLFDNILQNNPEIDKNILLEKTQTLLDRIVFIFFAEDRGILPTNTIKAIIDRYRDDIEDRSLYHFYKIYFKAINEGNIKLDIPEYNGGLFTEDEILQNLIIDDDVLDESPLTLSAYDFNSDIDVNILGHIFENSLNDIEEMKAKINDDDFDIKHSKRKKDGVFYTPEYITKYIVGNTLGKLCQDRKIELGLDETEIMIPKNPKKLNRGESNQKNALETYRKYLLSLKILDPACGSGAFLNQALNYLLEEHTLIDEGIKTLMGGSVLGLYDVKKGILENNLYGVDINAEAVEIAKLSLWLRTVESGRKLNNLADKIKVGNSLIDDKSVAEDAFVWEEEFSEVFAQGGFDVVIGNPPYVRQELLAAEAKIYFKEHCKTYQGTADLYVFFVEKGYSLLKDNGLFSYIFPNKWMRANYGKPLRKWLNDKKVEEIIDFGDLNVFEDATTYPIIMRIRKSSDVGVFRSLEMETLDFTDLKIYVDEHHSLTDQTRLDAKGWSLADIRVQNLMQKLQENGVPLGEYVNDEIYYGIKTGLNEAFVIDEETKNRLIEEDTKSAEAIKPLLAGRDIKRYETPIADKFLILFPKGWTRKNSGFTDEAKAWSWLSSEYPAIVTWLEPFTYKGKKRYDKGEFWWELRACEYYDAFENPKIIYPNILSKPEFTFDNSGKYTNQKCFIISSDDFNLLGYLNSSLMFFLFNQLLPKLRGDFFEPSSIFFLKFPIPNNLQSIEMETLALRQLKNHDTFQNKKNKFLKRVKDNFDLDKLTKKLEAFYETDFKTFLKELKKKKVTLNLIQQDEWEEYFEMYQKELLKLQSQIDSMDSEIDTMVYELYGLSDEEILVVEGKN